MLSLETLPGVKSVSQSITHSVTLTSPCCSGCQDVWEDTCVREAISLDEQIFKDTVRVIVKLAGWVFYPVYISGWMHACELRSTGRLLHLSACAQSRNTGSCFSSPRPTSHRLVLCLA